MSLVGFKAQNHPQQRPKPSVDDWATDPGFFADLHRRFRFTVDAAALPRNAKLPRFWTPFDNGLRQSWAGERVWCNPPYSSIWPWVRKAWSEPAALVVMILPANRTEQRWWQREVEPCRDRPGSRLRVEFLPGRIRFIHPDAEGIGPNERPPFGCCLLIWEAAALSVEGTR
ncbi:MAG: DNA N-6-adenine-methyltransferase [Vicinamibacterales bacterium]